MNRQQEIAELKERLEKLEAEERAANWPQVGEPNTQDVTNLVEWCVETRTKVQEEK